MLKPGESTEIQGSAAKPYVVKNHDGVIWSCSCPAWRNSGGAVEHKNCKHLKQVRGSAPVVAPAPLVTDETAEETLAAVFGSKVTNLSETPREEPKKLRPDEKAKLNGPPVLLAHPYDADIDPTGWWMSEKLDGVRAYWDGQQFISRQGNVFHAPAWFKAGLPNHPLDGEIWMARQKFQQTISVVKRLDGGDMWKQVSYLVFDIPHSKIPFEHRQDDLEKVCLNSNSNFLKLVQQTRCTGKLHLKQELDQLVALGAEGLMIRKPGSLYEVGRSHTILKVKPFKDAEAVVIGHTAGKGRHQGVVGALVCRMPSGREFSLGTGLSDADRRNPPKLGAVVTYSFTELTNDGSPKCAAFVAVRDYE